MLCCMHSKKIYIVGFLLIFFLSCFRNKNLYIHNQNTQNKTGTSVLMSRTYRLKKYQDYEFEERFKSIIEKAYTKTYEKYSINFTYSIQAQGAVYPFSEVNVNCIAKTSFLSSKSSENTCDFFLDLIDIEYQKIKGEIK